MTLFARSYDRIFTFPIGQVGVVADLYLIDDTIEIRELSLYPIAVDYLPLGTANLRVIYRQIEADIRELGFKKFRITAGRITGASPGRRVDVNRRLR